MEEVGGDQGCDGEGEWGPGRRRPEVDETRGIHGYTCDQTSTETRDDVRALHLSRARGMWTEVRGKGTRKGPEVCGGGGHTHKSAGKGPGPGQRLGMVTGWGPQSMMRWEGDRVEDRTKLWGLSWET